MIIRCAYVAGLSFVFFLQPVLASPIQDCPAIVSNIERLACFDQAAGTPAHKAKKQWSAPELEATSVLRVMANEATRTADDLTFRIGSQSEGSERAPEWVISAPAIASGDDPSYLAISCIQNISRLQLIARQPIGASWVTVRLKGDGGSRFAGDRADQAADRGAAHRSCE